MKLLATLAAALMMFGATAASAQVKTGYEDLTFEEVTAKAEAGDAKAQLDLGYRYYYQKDHKDDAKALLWFEKSAKQGDGWGEYETATMYELGEGTPADPATAFAWYVKSADTGIVRAYADIAIMYLEGDGVPKDAAKAVEWLEKGVAINDSRCETQLGVMYRDGNGVPKDVVKAEDLLTTAVRNRYLQAATILEAMYRDGIGVVADPVVSHAWRMVAAHLKNANEVGGGYVVLITPKLSEDDNMKAWQLYRRKVEAFGFIPDDKKMSDDMAEKAAREQFANMKAASEAKN